ncbi:MAG: ribonuclease E/G, partial [Burkholderiales bacterium]|nr:ribonuclease E/G [Burkholderiales bacterium]
TNINYLNDILLVDREIALLVEQKKLVVTLMQQKSDIACLYGGVTLYNRLLRDAKLDREIEVITNDELVFNNLSKYVDLWQINRVDLDYQLQIDIKSIKHKTQQNLITHESYSLEIHALSGINLIDINSHAAKLNFFQVNYFALDEIIRQIQLRDLTGIILIDLIKNMSTDEKTQIKNKVSNLVNKDWRHNKVLGFTNAELFEIIRTK